MDKEEEDEYGAELAAVVEETKKEIEKKEPKKSMLQSALENANNKPEEKINMLSQQEEELDKMMQSMFGQMMGEPSSNAEGAGAMPDITNIAKMLQSMGLESEGEQKVDDGQVKEAQKMFEECLTTIKKESEDAAKAEDSGK